MSSSGPPAGLRPLLYSRLPNAKPAHFRIFALSPGLPNDTIAGTLKETPFDIRTAADGTARSPVYECLSYVWGDAQNKTDIVVDGCILSVTQNLRTALTRFRLPDKQRFLWIDAICVDQQCDEEKSQQVALMQDIYERADCVLVWLGESEDEGAIAFKVFKELLQKDGPQAVKAWQSQDSDSAAGAGHGRFVWQSGTTGSGQGEYFQNPLFHGLSSFGSLVNNLEDWLRANAVSENPSLGPLADVNNAINDAGGSLNKAREQSTPDSHSKAAEIALGILAIQVLLARPFFKRVWIVQEVVLARKVIVYCGQDELDWWLLSLALAFAHIRSIDIGQTLGFQRFTDITLTGQRTRNKAARNELGLTDSTRTLSVLQQHREAQATDGRDKMYGLLGLLGRMDVKHSLRPDYTLTLHDLYISFAASTLESTGTLDILSVAHGVGTNLPSWVPDWNDSTPQPRSLLLRPGEGNDTHSHVRAFATSGASYLPDQRLVNGKELSLSGFEFDSLSKVEAPFQYTDGKLIQNFVRPTFEWRLGGSVPGAAMLALLKQRQTLFQLLLDFYTVMDRWQALAHKDTETGSYPTGESYDTVLLHTLEAGSFPAGKEQTTKAWAHFWANLHLGISAVKRALAGDASVQMAELYIPVMLPGQTAQWDAPLYGPVNLRRLARTKLGYLALVGPEAREGDAVVLLQGGRTPYIARQEGRRWSLVSDAYVHGIMYGEAWQSDRCREMIFV